MIKIKNPEKAFEEYPGPILLLAGPGTGKTYQLAERTKFLINIIKAKPTEIAIITFTNEAAKNMKARLVEVEKSTGLPFLSRDNLPHIISTMHSLGNRILLT